MAKQNASGYADLGFKGVPWTDIHKQEMIEVGVEEMPESVWTERRLVPDV